MVHRRKMSVPDKKKLLEAYLNLDYVEFQDWTQGGVGTDNAVCPGCGRLVEGGLKVRPVCRPCLDFRRQSGAGPSHPCLQSEPLCRPRPDVPTWDEKPCRPCRLARIVALTDAAADPSATPATTTTTPP